MDVRVLQLSSLEVLQLRLKTQMLKDSGFCFTSYLKLTFDSLRFELCPSTAKNQTDIGCWGSFLRTRPHTCNQGQKWSSNGDRPTALSEEVNQSCLALKGTV